MNTDKEEYRVYFERYEVSNYGNVRRKLKNGQYKTLSGTIDRCGYYRIHMCPLNSNDKSFKLAIHTMVAKCFLDKPPSTLHNEIDHKDRNTKNNYVSNLRWATRHINCRNTHNYKENIRQNTLKNGVAKFEAKVMSNGIRHTETFDDKKKALEWVKNGNYEDTVKIQKRGYGTIEKRILKSNQKVRYYVSLKKKRCGTFSTYEEAEEYLASLQVASMHP